jgi:hypothetical protein
LRSELDAAERRFRASWTRVIFPAMSAFERGDGGVYDKRPMPTVVAGAWALAADLADVARSIAGNETFAELVEAPATCASA